MKFLIIGLGNIGEQYSETRHNIGFKVADNIALRCDAKFELSNHSNVAYASHKGKSLIIIKPTTYMNLSGKAVSYWMHKENIPLEQILVVVDDLHLDFGNIRIRPNGSDAGHNGLKDIQARLLTNAYPRLRIGIGSEFRIGQQVDYVLGQWTSSEQSKLGELLDLCTDACLSFCLAGIKNTMNIYNAKKL